MIQVMKANYPDTHLDNASQMASQTMQKKLTVISFSTLILNHCCSNAFINGCTILIFFCSLEDPFS